MTADDFSEDDEELTRHQCPSCGQVFDAGGNKWERDGLVCPFCGEEVPEA